ncbi:hypothetical protein KGY73_09095 [bacterium]|nr:hypothetical protein [bacterium]
MENSVDFIENKRNSWKGLLFFLLVIIFLFPSCKPHTPEERVKEFLKNMVHHAEKKNLTPIMDRLSEDYSDFQGRNKRETQNWIEGYFDRYKGIVINLLSTRFEEINPTQASLETEVAFSSGVGKVLRKLLRYSTDIYRIHLNLVKREEKWMVCYAEWKYVPLDEIFPKSTKILKKIYPDLFT